LKDRNFITPDKIYELCRETQGGREFAKKVVGKLLHIKNVVAISPVNEFHYHGINIEIAPLSEDGKLYGEYTSGNHVNIVSLTIFNEFTGVLRITSVEMSDSRGNSIFLKCEVVGALSLTYND
jgi:hypothetical protein